MKRQKQFNKIGRGYRITVIKKYKHKVQITVQPNKYIKTIYVFFWNRDLDVWLIRLF